MLSDPWNTKLEPAPISPYRNSPAFRVLSGTIKGVYNAHRGLEGNENIMVYPSYLFGNTGKGFAFIASSGERGHRVPGTDTRFYWELSENIYRYNHDDFDKRDGLGGIHTINESLLRSPPATSIPFSHRRSLRYPCGQPVGDDKVLRCFDP